MNSNNSKIISNINFKTSLILCSTILLVTSIFFYYTRLKSTNNIEVTNLVYSKIKADGITDDTEVLKAELNNLQKGQTLITPSGVSRLTNIHMSSFKEGVTLDFSNTIFKVIDNHDISNGGAMFQFSLKNSKVLGLNTDGNRGNVPDNGNQIGEMFNFRINPQCENVTFKNTTIKNTTYCGVSLGNDLTNISFIDTICENIGEHIFYLPSGSNSFGNIQDFTIDGITINNFGNHPINKQLNHEVAILKAGTSSNSQYNRCSNFTIKNVTVHCDDSNCYSGVVLTGSNIDNVIIENVKASFENEYNNLEAIIYNAGGLSTNISLNNIENDHRIIYSYTSDTKFQNFKVSNYTCSGDNIPHINLVNEYLNCNFTNISTSPITTGNDADINFINCNFSTSNNRINLSTISNNLLFENCNFNSILNIYSSIAQIELGNVLYLENSKITFNNCKFDSSNFAFSIRNFNENANFEFNNTPINGRLVSVSNSNKIHSIVMNNVTLNRSLEKFTSDFNVIGEAKYNNITINP